jgi:NADH:ubiquinone oxidoreductase subunit 6 (subunit J)
MLPDPSPVFRPVPMVWPQQSRQPIPRRWRSVSAEAGLAAAVIVDLAVAVALRVLALGPFSRSAADANLPASLVLAAIAAACGTIGGWLAAPLSWRAEGRLEWAGAIFGLAALAVILGATLIGVGGMALAQVGVAEPFMKAFAISIGGGVAIALIGIAIYGVFVLPFTLVGAAIWAAMVWAFRRAERRTGSARS